MSNPDVEDFIQQNRALAAEVETYRGYWESDKHWGPRREFILRNIKDFQAEQLDHLLSLSMVWANKVFLGCRYVDKVWLLYAFVICSKTYLYQNKRLPHNEHAKRVFSRTTNDICLILALNDFPPSIHVFIGLKQTVYTHPLNPFLSFF